MVGMYLIEHTHMQMHTHACMHACLLEVMQAEFITRTRKTGKKFFFCMRKIHQRHLFPIEKHEKTKTKQENKNPKELFVRVGL